MASCCSPVRVCDVPIDLDGSDELTVLDILQQQQPQEQKSNLPLTSTLDLDDDAQHAQVPAAPQRQASTSMSSSWSSSSGSSYSDEGDEPFIMTSPLLASSAKWCWTSPIDYPTHVNDKVPHSASSEEDGCLGGSDWSSSSDTHDSGYFSRPHTMDDIKPFELECEVKQTAAVRHRSDSVADPSSQLFYRPINARDPTCPTQVMVKRIQSTRELDLIQYLNTPSMRYDPWNPSAPLLSLVNGEENDGDELFDEPWAVLEPLVAEYDGFATVEEVLDFVMQLLQGLVFLHESRIVHGDIRQNVLMMDAGNPDVSAPQGSSRIQRDVKYFFVDFTHAVVVGEKAEYLFREDLRDLGILLSHLSLDENVPELADLVVQMVDTETQRTSRLTSAKQMLDELEHIISDLSADRLKCPL